MADGVKVRLEQKNWRTSKTTRMPTHSAKRWFSVETEGKLAKPQLMVFLTQVAYLRICAHAGSDLDNEVGGWMAGKFCRDRVSGENFIIIDTVLPAEHTQQGPAHLTFTGDSQVTMHNNLQNNFPGKVLLGWYHTHPKMGVFLSNWDVWLHQNFFSEPWQVALVIEPHSSIGGFFIRQIDGSLETNLYYGFYELLGNPGRSVVFWKNLVPFDEILKE